jgi:hypothetical protein
MKFQWFKKKEKKSAESSLQQKTPKMGVVWSWLNQYVGHLTNGDSDAQEWSLDLKNINDCKLTCVCPFRVKSGFHGLWMSKRNFGFGIEAI